MSPTTKCYTWDRTAEGCLTAVGRALDQDDRGLLPIHPYFHDEGDEPELD